MSLGAAPRRETRSWLVRALHSLVFILPLTVPVFVVVGSPGGDGSKVEREVSTGNSGDAQFAFGTGRSADEVGVYRLFEVPDVGGSERVLILSGEILVTSPGGTPMSGEVRWTILRVGSLGSFGDPVGSGEIPVGSAPPTFPETTTLPFSTSGVPLPPGESDFWLCIESDNDAVHIAAYGEDGQSILVSYDGQPPSEVPSADIGATILIDVGQAPPTTPTGPPSTPTVIPPTPTPPPADLVDQRIPQAGAGPGSGQSYFDTEVISYNFDTSFSIQVDYDLYPRGGSSWTTLAGFTVPADAIDDVVLSEFIAPDAEFGQFAVLSQPDSPKSAHDANPMSQAVIFARLPDGREFGQFFQARTPDRAQQAGETSLLFTTHDPVRYRVNVGVAAVEDGTRVRLTPLGEGGVGLAPSQTVELDDGGSTQVNDIDRAWSLGGAPNVMVRVEVLEGAAFPYASVLDGRGQVAGTSDPTTILPVTEGSRQVVLLEMGRITGLDEFSGSAMVYNHNPVAATVAVSFHERGVPGVADSTMIQVPGNGVLSWDDAVGDLVGRTGVVGSLVFESGGNRPVALSAIGREFAIFTDNGQITGTAGQLLPGLVPADQLMPGETFHFIGLRDRQTPQGRERSHLGVLNLGDADVQMTVAAYGADGAFEGMVDRTVRAGEQLRVNNVLRAANPNVDDGFKRIEVTADGPLHVLAYRVNATGDPVTLRPFRR